VNMFQVENAHEIIFKFSNWIIFKLCEIYSLFKIDILNGVQ
jgi:hypothetical protein